MGVRVALAESPRSRMLAAAPHSGRVHLKCTKPLYDRSNEVQTAPGTSRVSLSAPIPTLNVRRLPASLGPKPLKTHPIRALH
jgi:hypothetical protein